MSGNKRIARVAHDSQKAAMEAWAIRRGEASSNSVTAAGGEK